MDLSNLTKSPTDVIVGGRTFKIGPLNLLAFGVIQRYLDEQGG